MRPHLRYLLVALVLTCAHSAPAKAEAPPGPVAPTAPAAPTAARPFAGPARPRLALTLKEAIVRGIAHNLELDVGRISIEIARAGVEVPRGAFDPVFFSDGSYGKRRGPLFAANPFGGPINPITGLPGGLAVNPVSTGILDAGVRGRTILGTSLEMRYDVSRGTTDNVFALSPAWAPALTLGVTQPILRGFGTDVNRATIRIAKNDRRVSEAAFEDQALATALSVEEAYWGYVFARESVKVAEMALSNAERLLGDKRQFLAAGKIARIEVTIAEAGAAARREAVIVARNEVLNARDNLLRLILPIRGDGSPRGAASWDVDLTTLDEPRPDDRPVDLERAIGTALEARPDVRQVRLALASDELRILSAGDARWPRLDATGSWSQVGLGKSWGNATKEQFEGDFYEWQVGFNVEVPLFSTTARAQLRQSELSRAQNRRRLAAVEQNTVFEVRTTARNVEAAAERVRATEVAERLAADQFGAEEQRLKAGLTTSYDVLIAEENLTTARTNHLKAKVDRVVARARLERATAVLLDRHGVRIE